MLVIAASFSPIIAMVIMLGVLLWWTRRNSL